MSGAGASPARAVKTFDAGDWTRYTETHPRATLYHTLQWRDFIADLFGHAPLYVAAEANGRLTGVLPLFHVNMPLLGSKLLSLPYDIGSGGALADDDDTERVLVTHAMEAARELGVDYLELRHGSPRPALDALGLRRQEPVVISDMLLDGETAVRARISPDHRKAVRKASTRGIRVRLAENLSDYLAFFDVYVRVFRDFGTPPYQRRYFSALWERLHGAGDVRLFLAELESRCVGGLLLFCWQRSLVSKFAACLPEAVPLRAYAALYWRAIEFGLAEGYQHLSWGTSSRGQTGLIEFKDRWGSTTRPAVLYDLDVRGRAPDIASYYDSQGLGQRLWRRLPLVATRAGGAVLNRWFC
jgi:FemAB-related protein (PEP-CTERM system-associated)